MSYLNTSVYKVLNSQESFFRNPACRIYMCGNSFTFYNNSAYFVYIIYSSLYSHLIWTLKKEIFSLCCRDHNTSHTSRRHVFPPHYKCVLRTCWLLPDVGWLVISKNIAHFPFFHIKDQRIFLHIILSSSAIVLTRVCAAFTYSQKEKSRKNIIFIYLTRLHGCGWLNEEFARYMPFTNVPEYTKLSIIMYI